MEQGSMYDQSHCCVLARFDSRQTGEFKILANLLDFCQRASDARAERLGDQLGTSRADVLVERAHRHDLAVLVAADGGKDGAPALVPELVASEVDGRQCAIDAQGASYGLDSFWISDNLCIAIVFMFIMPANNVL